MTTTIEVHGVCDSRFAAVRDAFAENFASRGEIGAAVTAVVDGDTAVDLWAGHADAARTRPWQRDTIVHVFSTTKGIVTVCAHRLAARVSWSSTPPWRSTGRSSRRRARR